MKKIGKKLSFVTRILLVMGLLFSNLSCLTSVFAYEGEEKVTIDVVNDEITVKYLDELNLKDEVIAKISEVYTYLDGTYDEDYREEVVYNELLVGDGSKTTSSILSNISFDGLYELKVELYDETTSETLGLNVYSKNIKFDSSLGEKVYLNGKLIKDVDGVYYVNGDVDIKYTVLASGMSPSDRFILEDEEVSALELIGKEFTTKKSFLDKLYGEHSEDISKKILKVIDDEGNTEDVSLTKSIKFVYYNSDASKAYYDNVKILNDKLNLLGLQDRYLFDASGKDGVLYVTTPNKEGYSVNDLIKLLDSINNDTIIRKISNGLSDDLNLEYDQYLDTLEEGVEPLSKEEYFSSILVDNDTEISISDTDLTITFKCVFIGDMNGDGKITDEDIKILINQILTIDLENLVNGDMNKDGKLDDIDLFYLYQAYKGNWSVLIEQVTKEADVEASIKVNEEDIASGEEFTVSYIIRATEDDIKAFLGRVDYDKDKLELLEVNSDESWLGNVKDNQFIYMVNEAIVGTEKVEVDLQDDNTVTYDPVSYKALTLRFRAKASGEASLGIVDGKFFGENSYYTNLVSVTDVVIINKSSDATLSSLSINGKNIELKEDTLKYNITVGSDVTELDVKAIVNNLMAEVTEIVIPEELVTGENKVKVLVTAEDGTELVYEIIVTKEAKEEVKQVNYQDTIDNDNKSDNVKPLPDDGKKDNDDDKKDDNKEEKDGSLSRIIIIILILLVIAGLIYLIFKDEKDDNETKKANKDIDKYKKGREFVTDKQTQKVDKPKNKEQHKNNNKKEG